MATCQNPHRKEDAWSGFGDARGVELIPLRSIHHSCGQYVAAVAVTWKLCMLPRGFSFNEHIPVCLFNSERVLFAGVMRNLY